MLPLLGADVHFVLPVLGAARCPELCASEQVGVPSYLSAVMIIRSDVCVRARKSAGCVCPEAAACRIVGTSSVPCFVSVLTSCARRSQKRLIGQTNTTQGPPFIYNMLLGR